MLCQLRDFIRQQGVVSLQQLSRAFRIEIAALEPMLDIWVRKGVIHPQRDAVCKSTCFKCKPSQVYYQYGPQRWDGS